MRATIDKIREQVLHLSASERASLAHDLILSLDAPDTLALDEEMEFKIQRRVQEVREGRAKGRPLPDVLSDIRSHFK